MKVVIVAGGTGGHIYPAIELAQALKNKDNEIIFFGNNLRMESKLIPQAGFDFFGFDISAISGSLGKVFSSLLLMNDAYKICKNKLKEIKPDVVIGFGNYVSVPVILAAKRLKIKTIIHEQNSIIGGANKFLSHLVDEIVVSFEETLKGLPKNKSHCYGNPRSNTYKNIDSTSGVLKDYGLKKDKPTVLIFMGSLGSKSINDFMLKALKQFRNKKYQVLYITGEKYYDDFVNNFNESDNVKVVAYADVVRLLPSITLLISRSGATTITEITSLGVAAIMIPSPYVPANHQFYNAKNLVDNQAGILLLEKDLEEDKFVKLVDETVINEVLLSTLRTNAKALAYLSACDDFINLIEKVVNNE